MKITQRIKIGEVCSFLNGGTPSKSVERYFEGENPWITGADITSPVVTKARSYITKEAIESSATNLVPAGTVLLVTRTSVGKVAIAGVDLCFSQDITALTPDTSRLHAPYLVEFIKTQEAHFEQQARGATIKGITRQVVEELQIPLPPLAEQRRIAEVLDKAEELRAKRRAALAQLDTLTQSIFLEMFGDPRVDGSRWSFVQLEQIVRETKLGLVRGSQEFGHDYPIPYVRMNAITRRGELNLADVQRTHATQVEVDAYRLEPGDFLFNTRNSEELVGKTALYRGDGVYLFNNNLMRIRFTDDADAEYVAAAFRTASVQHELNLRKSGTTNVFAIYYKDLKTLPLPLPPISLQRQFAQRVAAVEKLKATQRVSLAELDTLFASLQHRAFSGSL